MADSVDAAGSGVVGGFMSRAATRVSGAAANAKAGFKIDSSGVKDLKASFDSLHTSLMTIQSDLEKINASAAKAAGTMSRVGTGSGGGGNGAGRSSTNNNGGGHTFSSSSTAIGAAAGGLGIVMGMMSRQQARVTPTNQIADSINSQYASVYGTSRNAASGIMTSVGYGTREQQLQAQSLATQYGFGGARASSYSAGINQIMGATNNTDPALAASTYLGFANPQTTWASMKYGMAAPGAINPNGTANSFNDIVKSWGTSGLIGGKAGVAPTSASMDAALLPGSRARNNLSANGISGDSQDALLQALAINGQTNGGTTNFADFSTGSMKAKLNKALGKAQGANSTKDQDFMNNNYDTLQNAAEAQTLAAKAMDSLNKSLNPLITALGPAAPLVSGIAGMGKNLLELGGIVQYLGKQFGVNVIGSLRGAVGGVGAGGSGGFATMAGEGGLTLGGVGLGTAAGIGLAGGVAGYAGAKAARALGANGKGAKSTLARVGAGAVIGAGVGSLAGPLGVATVPVGAAIGGVLGAVGGMFGDAAETAAKSKSDPAGFTPEFRRRLDNMLQANPAITITAGSFRSHQDQINLFLSRYVQDPNGTKTYNGKKWRLKPGMAPAATPGNSLHEYGEAADLGPSSQWGWIAANAAAYGLDIKTGLSIGEPWHLQLSGAKATGSARDMAPAGTSSSIANTSVADSAQDGGMQGYSSSAYLDTSGGVSATMASLVQQGLSSFVAGSAGSSSSSASSGSTGGSTAAASSPSGGKLGIDQVVQFAYQAGFRGTELTDIVAIAMRESHGDPNAIHDSNKSHDGTKDMSYGLTQVNFWPGSHTLKQFGLSNLNQMLDPLTNMRAAFQIRHDGGEMGPWGRYKGADPLRGTNVPAAAAAVRAAGYKETGDAAQRGYSTSMGAGTIIHVHAPISILANGSSSSEAQRLAGGIAANIGDALSKIANR